LEGGHKRPHSGGARSLVEGDLVAVAHLADVLVFVEEHILVAANLFEEDLEVFASFFAFKVHSLIQLILLTCQILLRIL